MTSLLEPSPLFKQANAASQVLIATCARSVLRQVVLESLERHVNLDNSQIVLTPEHLDSVRQDCRSVADAWCSKLRERGHYQASSVVQDVVRREEGDLYFVDEEANEEDALHSQPLESTLPAASSADNTAPSHDEDEHRTHVTSLSRIRELTKQNLLGPDPIDKEKLLEEANRRLEQLGRQQRTDWPYSWDIIEQKVQEIPGRLYNTKREASVIELVPKSIWDKHQNQNADHPQDSPSEQARQLVLRRRKRNINTKTLPISKRQKMAPPVEDIPRLASTQPEKIQLTQLDDPHLIAQADRYLHPESISSETFDGYALAPLLNLGYTHYSRQHIVDARDTTSWSSRQLRSAQHRAKKERFGPHNAVKESEGTKSKVRRTVDLGGNYWLDFDLGRTLLELGQEDDKRLYWFETVEAMLLDEDTDEALGDTNDSVCIPNASDDKE